jgi:HlyD family secretion protein
MAYLKAEGGIKVEGLEAEMVQINTEMALNQKLTQQFKPTESADLSNGLETAGNPQQLAVRSLQEKKKLHQEATAIKINEMKKGHAADILILENDIALKQKELELLLAEKKKLNKYANFNGVVESVFVRSGEQVEAFAPIISINPRHPSSIIGYMVGPKARPLAVGEKVTVTSYDHKNITATGKIIGFGAINELPEILQKTTAIKAFGREVFIKIPEENLFATGEKVLIK